MPLGLGVSTSHSVLPHFAMDNPVNMQKCSLLPIVPGYLILEVGFKFRSFKVQKVTQGMKSAVTNASCWFSLPVTAL